MEPYNIPGIGTISHGTMVEAVINGKKVTGKISLRGSSYRGQRYDAWICQDTNDGHSISDKLGYKYSYWYDKTISNDVSNVRIMRILSGAAPDPVHAPDTPFLNASVGRIHSGDYIKVVVPEYKPGIMFKCHLVIHGGKYYLNNDKINNTAGPGVPKIKGYPNLYQFTPGSTSVKFKEIVERADVPAPKPEPAAVRLYPPTPDDVYVSSEDLDYKPYGESSKPMAIAKPTSSDTQRVTIRRRKVLRVNQNI